MNIQLFQHHWLQWLPYPPWNSFGIFVKSSCLQLTVRLVGLVTRDSAVIS